MQITQSDERDSSWEDHRPHFRVYLFAGGDEPTRSWSVETFDLVDADVLEVINWAEATAGDQRLYAVALVGEHRPDGDVPSRERGLTWLVGMNANDTAKDELEARLLRGMRDRRSRRGRPASS